MSEQHPTPVHRGVYFIEGGSFIKIGWSTDIVQRLRELQPASPLKLKLLSYIQGEGLGLERWLHERYRMCRRHGEWFDADREPELRMLALGRLPLILQEYRDQKIDNARVVSITRGETKRALRLDSVAEAAVTRPRTGAPR